MQSEAGPQQSALSRSVRPQDGPQLSSGERESNSSEDWAIAVPRDEGGNVKDAHRRRDSTLWHFDHHGHDRPREAARRRCNTTRKKGPPTRAVTTPTGSSA